MESKLPALINIDSGLKFLTEEEKTASVVDAYFSSMAFKNLDNVPRRLPHVLELTTHEPRLWKLLVEAANQMFRVESMKEEVLVFDATIDCGCIRTYRFRGHSVGEPLIGSISWTKIKDEMTFYELLNSPTAKAVFKAWVSHKEQVTNLPTVLVDGRIQNTSVEKAIIFF